MKFHISYIAVSGGVFIKTAPRRAPGGAAPCHNNECENQRVKTTEERWRGVAKGPGRRGTQQPIIHSTSLFRPRPTISSSRYLRRGHHTRTQKKKGEDTPLTYIQPKVCAYSCQPLLHTYVAIYTLVRNVNASPSSSPSPSRQITGKAHSLNVTSSAKVAVVSSSVLMAAPPDTWSP